jgi:predicted SAM-dependent methyltransferase
MRLNLGCGAVAPADWLNVDFAIGARLDSSLARPIARRLFSTPWPPNVLIHDLTKRFPWPDGSADAVYSSHTLEHLSREAGEHFIAECRRVLKPGGVIRIVVPDLGRIVGEYQVGHIDGRDFLAELGAHAPWAGRGRLRQIAALFSGSRHLCMYDEEALTELLTCHGFACRRAAPFESAIPDIADIEREDRARGELIIEGR